MKTYLLLVALLHNCFSLDITGDEFLEDCENGTIIYDDNSSFVQQSSVTTMVKFYLLTPSNETIKLNSTNLHLLNTSHPTKVIIHGLGDYQQQIWIDEMAQVYHTKGNYNIIAVDWSMISIQDKQYVVEAVDDVGNLIGSFIMQITETDTEYLSDVHLIGSSLGAQVSGAAGENVAQKGKKLGRITGLDPTEPEDLKVLNEDDAEFVDVIHTSVQLGERKSGTVDFYVVDGEEKPICLYNKTVNSTDSTQNGTCGELLADQYYTTSIIDGGRFEGISCYNSSLAVERLCDRAKMGEYVSRNVSGNYLVAKDSAHRLSTANFMVSWGFALVLLYLCV